MSGRGNYTLEDNELGCIRARHDAWAARPFAANRVTNAGRAAHDRRLLLDELRRAHERIAWLERRLPAIYHGRRE